VLGMMIYMFVDLLLQESKTDEQSNDLIALGFALLLAGAISLFVLSVRLETHIKEDGLYVRLFPFHLSVLKFKWADLRRCYIRQYNPILEYGGWGLRWGLFGKGKAYNIAGNMGLQLELANGKKILIGTQNPEELRRTLEKLQHYSA
ncbi:MAG TPA: DUF6141 family protein, partial [Saprospiraceae bacterium]|nr:DUF6141 family protein [Saprospiraceae bacterium]